MGDDVMSRAVIQTLLDVLLQCEAPQPLKIKALAAVDAARAALASPVEAPQAEPATKPEAGHPLLQALVDSIDGCWDYLAMYAVRDALTAAPLHPVAAPDTVALIDECRKALAEELSAYDIDPPIHHVEQAHNKCVAWLSAEAKQRAAAPPPEQAAQPAVGALTPEQSAAYDKVDHILRSVLMDKDYAEYSAALDILTTPPAQVEQPALTDERIGEIWASVAEHEADAVSWDTVRAFAAALTRKQTPAVQTGAPAAGAYDSPLCDFQEGQWWVRELDALAASRQATDDQKRAVAVVHHMLRAALATTPAVQAEQPAEPKPAQPNIPGLAADPSAFVRWAEPAGYDMTSHPLHFLFLNEKTYAARQGWNACRDHYAAAPREQAEDAARLSADAERYRWLREQVYIDREWGILRIANTFITGDMPAALDAAIDAARADARKGEAS
jgi:hypothetical protein